MNKDFIKNRYYLRKLAKNCHWPAGYRRPVSFPVIAVWGYENYEWLNITYVYEHDFKTTSV